MDGILVERQKERALCAGSAVSPWTYLDSRHHSSGGCHYPQFSFFHQCRDLFLLDWKLFQQLQGAAIHTGSGAPQRSIQGAWPQPHPLAVKQRALV